MSISLFDPWQLGSLQLRNRIVMAPMTRSRAVENNTANALMAEYYAQRASAGLLITEGPAEVMRMIIARELLKNY